MLKSFMDGSPVCCGVASLSVMLCVESACDCLIPSSTPPITSPSERKKAEKAAAKQRQVEEEQARQAEEAAKR